MWGISISASYFILVALRQDSHSLLRKLLFSYAPSCFYLLDWMGFGFVCGSRDCRGPRRQRQHRCQFPVTVHPPCGDLNPFSEPEPDSPYVVRPWSMRRYRRGRRTERRGEEQRRERREDIVCCSAAPPPSPRALTTVAFVGGIARALMRRQYNAVHSVQIVTTP